jgi:hypothetical protein
MKTIQETLVEIRQKIEQAYETGVTMPEAEKLAAMSLSHSLALADELKKANLDARMKKHGVKAVRAAVYMEELKKHDKKPAEAYLENAVNLSELVEKAELSYAEAEVEANHLEAYVGVLKESHIYYRGIAKGNYEG